jgi:hypothetical protein
MGNQCQRQGYPPLVNPLSFMLFRVYLAPPMASGLFESALVAVDHKVEQDQDRWQYCTVLRIYPNVDNARATDTCLQWYPSQC